MTIMRCLYHSGVFVLFLYIQIVDTYSVSRNGALNIEVKCNVCTSEHDIQMSVY